MKTWFLCLCLLLLGAAPAMAKLPPEARQAMHKAQLLMDKQSYGEAAQIMSGYMKTTQETIHEKVYLFYGGALYKSGERTQALAVFRKGFDQYPSSEYLSLNIGVALFEAERFAEAGRYLEKTHALQAVGKPNLLYQAGSAYYQGKAFTEAGRVLEKLIASSTPPRKEWIRLAVHALWEAKQTGRAVAMLNTFLSTAPEEAEYWRLLAKLHLERKEYAKAAASLDIYTRLRKPTAQDMEQLASLYSHLEAPLMAAATLKRAYASAPEQKNVLKVAALYASAGRIDAAVRHLDQYARNGSADLEKGRMLYQSRRFSEAETTLAKALDTPEDAEARLYLALCAWERRDWKAAKSQLERIAGMKRFRSQTANYLAVIDDIETARREASL